MKTRINHFFLLAFFALLPFLSCQDEIMGVDNPNEQETILPDSQLASLMTRTTANFGAMDNILDGSSCFSVELPVTVIVSDVTIIIETEDDLEYLEDLFDDFDDDDDFLDFIFPITIIFNDYTEIVIENEDQLENLFDDCDDDEDDIIECVDFVYPISFSVFNTGFDLLETVTIDSDEALYNFLDDLEDEDNALIVSLNYPLTLEYANGETIEVNSNEELANAIAAAEDDCDDYDDDCEEEELEDILTECPWEVFLYTNDDLENLSGPFTFNFNENGTLHITGVLQNPYETTWDLTETDNGLELNIASLWYYEEQFGNWLVVECDDDDLEFIHLTVDGTGLLFEQDCEDDLDCSLTDISGILQECPWDIDDEFNDFEIYQIVFNADGSLAITEGETTNAIGGNWSLTSTDNGLILSLSDLTAFQEDLGGDWLIVECDDDEIEIVRGDYSIELEQDCEGDLGCSVADINAILGEECFWELETNLIDSVVPIYVYFTPNGQILVANNNSTENQIGVWELVEVTGGIYIEFTLQLGFEVLNGQWQIVECENDELFLVNGNNYIELDQECDLFDDDVFDCFSDFELVECIGPNNEAEFNLSADTIGLIDCPYTFAPSFHVSEADAEANVNAIADAESYWSASGQVFLRIEAESGNFEVFTVYLNTEECNYFECFGNYDLTACDQNDDVVDGFALFDLNLIFDNCPNDDVAYTFHETLVDAQNDVLALPSPFINTSNPQTIYSRVSLAGDPSVFEIFTHNLIVEDCNESCSEEDVDAFLLECLWNAVNYNGSDNLMEWNLDFNANSQLIVSNDSTTISAMWTTSMSTNGVIVTLSNIAGPNIQAITGEWLVVECEEDRLELHQGDNILVLERTCN